jgi:formate/nitrite transporter FocA (FNT family)
MSVAPTPVEIYRRAVNEGDRRLSATGVELLATGFNAGFTIVFGIAALSIVHGLIEPTFGPEVAKLAGAAGFGIGLLFLVTSRAELFTENFFDPVATAFHRGEPLFVLKLLRLWIVVLGLNLIGGAILVLILSVDGVLPPGSERALRTVAEEIAAKDVAPAFANAVVGGAIVTLLSFLLQAVDRVLSRMVVAYLIGFLLAVGPFAHVVVTAQHLLFGAMVDAPIGFDDIAADIGIAIVGNLLGGLGFVTLTHLAQARGEGARAPANDLPR